MLLIPPILPEEFLVGKALAVAAPTLTVAYTVFGIFPAAAALFAQSGIASAVFEGSHLLVQILFTPLLAGWSIWVGIAISARRRPLEHEETPRERRPAMSATLMLRREGAGIELRRGRFEVALDGSDVGSIDWHQTAEMPVEPGRHSLQIRAGRYSSRAQAFEVADGEAVSFRCHGAMLWPRYVASIVAPNLGISLRRE